MPMGNRMGPLGAGPGTGRGAGYCNGNNMPGTYNRGGRGFGFGRSGARGCRTAGGYGRGFNAQPQPVDSETLMKAEAEVLEARLNFIREQLGSEDKDSE